MKLLQIDSSIQGTNSASRAVAAAVVERFRQLVPDLSVTYRNLAETPLPHVTLGHFPPDHPIAAAVGAAQKTPELETERAESQRVLDEFLAAGVVVIGAPMYNLTVPSQLKAWIDRVLIVGKTFAYTPEGLVGLAGGKRVIIAISRGNFYGPGAPAAAVEHVETYLRAIFGFMGITNLDVIVAEGLGRGPEVRGKAMEAAMQAVAQLQAA